MDSMSTKIVSEDKLMKLTLLLLTGLLFYGCSSTPQTIIQRDTTYIPQYIYRPAKTDSSGTISLNKDSTEARFVMRDSTVIIYKVLPKDRARLAKAIDSLQVLNGMLYNYIPKDSVLAYLRSIETQVTVTQKEEGSWIEHQIWRALVLAVCLFIIVAIIRKVFKL